MSDVSAVTHLLAKVNEGFVTTTGSSITSGAATVPLTSVTGLTNGTTFVGIIEPGAANQQTFTGIVDVSGSQVTGVHWTRGTNVAHSGGVTVVDYTTGTIINMITKWAGVQHNDDGTHSIVTATGLSSTGWFTVTPTVVTTGSTLTPSSSQLNVTAQGSAANIAAPSGTFADGSRFVIRIKDNGTPQGLTYDAVYRDVGITRPTTTVAGKTTYIGGIYNALDSRVDLVAVRQEA